MNPIINIFKSPEILADAFAKTLLKWVKDSEDEYFHIALSGGKTPSLLFSLLAEKYGEVFPWDKIHIWWGDERMVPPSDPESNYGVVNTLLFSKIRLNPYQIHRIKGECDAHEEALRYSTEIQSLVPIRNGWPTFSLILLGLGDDGHTASIFPGQQQLFESSEYTTVALHPNSGQLRITLTGKVLNSAKKVVFLVAGTSKSQIFNDIINGSKNASFYPASLIRPEGELHWFVDDACAMRSTNQEG